MMDEMPLPPTYIPPESTQAMDATFYYIVGGMTLLAAAFGNIIILNFVSLKISTHCTLLVFSSNCPVSKNLSNEVGMKYRILLLILVKMELFKSHF